MTARPTPRTVVAARWLVVLLGLLALAGPGAGVAGAHATLVSSDPANDEVVATRPASVRLTFDEPVVARDDGVRVLDPTGAVVSRGPTRGGEGGRQLTTRVATDVPAGSYTVSYRVLSDDGHVISGSFLYHVERRTGSAPAADATSGGTGPRLLQGLGRWIAYSAALLAGGVLAMAVWVDRAGGRWSGGIEASRRLLLPAAAMTLFGTGLLVLGSAAELGGSGLADGPGRVGELLGSGRPGAVLGVRVAVALVLLLAVAGRPLLRSVPWLAGICVLATLVLPSIGGHAATAGPVAVAVGADVVHLLAAAAWVGGLGVLVLTWDGDGGRVRRFSGMALVAAPLVVLSGVVGGWLHTRSLGAVTSTDYGRLLLAKLAGALLMLAIGLWARRRLVRPDAPVGGLLGGLRAEAMVGIGVLAVTAVLVATPPAVEASLRPVSVVRQAGDITVRMQVEPARSGPNTVHLYYLARDGSLAPVDAAELQVATRGVEPRRVPVTPLTPSHAIATDVQLTPGRWAFRLTVVARGVPARTTFEVPIP
ncbi:MAG: copper resistance protein CopC [Microthrixaceae bacterium]